MLTLVAERLLLLEGGEVDATEWDPEGPAPDGQLTDVKDRHSIGQVQHYVLSER